MSSNRVLPVEQPRRLRLLPFAAAALGAAFVLGAGAVSAQGADEPMADGIDGTWTLDTGIGDFADFSSSWVGFRVAEVLSPGGEVEAVGRTPAVSGQLTASGTVLESASIEADLSAIVSDRSRRDPAIQRALGTSEYPTASFMSVEPFDLGEIPGDDPFTASLPGIVTIRDVSQPVTLEITGQRVGDTVVVVGSLPVDFTSYGVTMPTAPIVVSVADEGDLEWQLFFTRAGESDDEMADDDADAGEDASTDAEGADAEA